jgi:hypothetical protein
MGLIFGAGDVSAVVQALFTMLGFLVSVVTLVILFFYARDTRTLAQVAARQEEDAVVPYLTFGHQTDLVGTRVKQTSLTVSNKGKGPAIGIRLKAQQPPPGGWVDSKFPGSASISWKQTDDELGDIGPGETRTLGSWPMFSAARGNPVTLSYTSMNGLHYESTFLGGKMGKTHQTFRRIKLSGSHEGGLQQSGPQPCADAADHR